MTASQTMTATNKAKMTKPTAGFPLLVHTTATMDIAIACHQVVSGNQDVLTASQSTVLTIL